MKIDPLLHRIVAAQPYPLLFATISGSHLYGFPSPDSDFDLRGVHVLPLEKVVGLETRDETIQQQMIVPANTAQPCPGPADERMSNPGGSPIAAGPEAAALRQAGTPDATFKTASEGQGLEMDIVSHDARKFFGLLLKKNGYVLEQLFSPLIVHTTPEHEELKEICRARIAKTSPSFYSDTGSVRRAATDVSASSGRNHPGEAKSLKQSDCAAERGAGSRSARTATSDGKGAGLSGVMTKHHSHHYFGFAETQWNLFFKESPRRVKPLLYVYRVLLTGIHLMRTGVIEANVLTLNEEFRLPFIGELVARKLAGPEQSKLEDADVALYEAEYQRLRGELQAAHDASTLPETPSEETRAALNDLLVRLRLKGKVELVN